MKIVYISAGEIPSERANSIQVMKVCQAFARQGHDITLLSPSAQAVVPSWDDLALHYGLTTPFEILFVPIRSTLKRRDFARKAVLKARSLGAELIYARSLPPVVLGLLAGIPVILEMHQLPGGSFGPIWYRLFLKRKGRKRLVIITQALKQTLESRYTPVLPDAKVVVAPSGVDLDRYNDLPDSATARSRLKLPSGWTVVCSGHMYEGRGMHLFAELARRMPNVNFLWAGGTEQDVETWRRHMMAGGLKNVTLTGFIPNSELPLYQAAADALLIPYSRSFTNSGGENISAVSSPMKIFEYMAAGRVIVGSDLPVLREVLNETNAILCPPEDIQAWEQTLHNLQADAGPGQLLADQSRRDAEKYSWDARCKLILAGFMDDQQ